MTRRMPDLTYTTNLEPFRGALRKHCSRLCGEMDAEDLAQESLLKAWRHLPRFEGRSSIQHWLYTIATRTCLDRARPCRAPLTDDGHGAENALEGCECPSRGPEEACHAREEVACAMSVALQQLPQRQRAALLLREVMGYSAEDCAQRLQMSVPAVNSALQRARRTLEMAGRPDCGRRHDAALAPLLRRCLEAFYGSDVDALADVLSAAA
jgi:RNA polymerase sigma-70 factor (ECF subfamily)